MCRLDSLWSEGRRINVWKDRNERNERWSQTRRLASIQRQQKPVFMLDNSVFSIWPFVNENNFFFFLIHIQIEKIKLLQCFQSRLRNFSFVLLTEWNLDLPWFIIHPLHGHIHLFLWLRKLYFPVVKLFCFVFFFLFFLLFSQEFYSVVLYFWSMSSLGLASWRWPPWSCIHWQTIEPLGTWY